MNQYSYLTIGSTESFALDSVFSENPSTSGLQIEIKLRVNMIHFWIVIGS
jgi:hypothetical protein